MRVWFVVLSLAWLLAPRLLAAADYQIEAAKEAPPAGKLAQDITSQLAPTGFKVLADDKRVVCEIWLARQWTAKADFQPSDSVLYGLEPGSFVGVLRFPRKGTDFRGQDIPAGLYTLRYADQPVDGNHVGTFETRDFLLLTPADADASPQPIVEADLFKLSAQSAESSHPAIMPLVKADAAATPALRHLEEQGWWTARLAGQDAKGAKVVIELVVVGKAAE